jgi:transglutaminase-like putative cysteine protease
VKRLDWAGALAVLLPFVALCMLNPDPVSISLAALAGIACFLRGRLQTSRTLWLLWSLIGVVASVGAFRSDQHRALASGLVYANIYPVAISLGWACLPALLRRHTRHQYWMTMTLSGVFFLICGLNLMPIVIEFGFMSALWMVCFCISSRQFITDTRPSRAAWLTLIPTTILLVILTLIFSYSEVQFGFLMRLLSAGGDVGLTFPSQNKLNTMLNSETNPAVVARCFSRQPNTYLPGRVYTNFKDGTWTEFAPSSQAPAQPSGEGYRYLLADPQPAPTSKLERERFEVRASPIVFFCPRDTVWLESKESNLALLSGHLLEQRGGGNDLQVYTVARQPAKDLAPPESPEYLKACLQLPEHLDPIVEETAKKVLVGPKDVWKQSLACQIWFQNNFEYGFGYDFAGAKDPIADFLRKKPPAHCELFAASMTLMLRTQGIPARYVNGFVCVERSWGSDYYVVRVRDAHAWVEVWDGKAWRVLDPTPPSAIQTPDTWGSWFDKLREAFNYYTSNLGNLDWRAVVAAAWERRAYFGGFFVLYLLWRARKTRWFPRLSEKTTRPPESEWVRSLSRALQPKDLGRHEWEPLLQWAARLEDGEISQWLQDYSAYRYGGAPEARLGQRLAELVKRLQNPPS